MQSYHAETSDPKVQTRGPEGATSKSSHTITPNAKSITTLTAPQQRNHNFRAGLVEPFVRRQVQCARELNPGLDQLYNYYRLLRSPFTLRFACTQRARLNKSLDPGLLVYLSCGISFEECVNEVLDHWEGYRILMECAAILFIQV
jgi:hypothetical protein